MKGRISGSPTSVAGTASNWTPPASLGQILAFAAGFADTCGFVSLSGLFTAHVTGNLVLIGASLAGVQEGGMISKLVALPVFCLLVIVTRIAVARMQYLPRQTTLAVILAVEALFLLGFMSLGVIFGPFASADSLIAIATGMLGVAAMAIQNATARILLGTQVPSTVMTGNVTQLVLDLVDIFARRVSMDGRQAARSRVKKMAPVILSFVIGAAAGALGYGAIGFWCLAAPTFVVFAASWLVRTSKCAQSP